MVPIVIASIVMPIKPVVAIEDGDHRSDHHQVEAVEQHRRPAQRTTARRLPTVVLSVAIVVPFGGGTAPVTPRSSPRPCR